MELVAFTVRQRNYHDYRGYYRSYASNPRCYVRLSYPQSTMVDDLVLRHMHNPRRLRPLVIATLKDKGLIVSKLHWSKNAGCSSCPCSPGFVVDDFTADSVGEFASVFSARKFDCWIEYTGA